MLKCCFTDIRINGVTDKKAEQKLYTPDLLMGDLKREYQKEYQYMCKVSPHLEEEIDQKERT